MRFVVYKVPLAGSSAAQTISIPTPSQSLTFYADTTTLQLLVSPSDGSDAAPVNNGGALTLENASGALISPCRITLNCASAVNAFIVQGLP